MQFHKTSRAENRLGSCDLGELGWEWWGLQRNNVSLTVQRLLPLQTRLRHDPQLLSCDNAWTFVPSAFSCFKCSYGQASRKADLMGKEIHLDTFSPSLILSVVLWHKLSLSVCALTEVQGNYWNIWMAGPSLNPLTNDAWLLQKGTGRTLLPLTDISHQRSMTSPALGWSEAVKSFRVTLLILRSIPQNKQKRGPWATCCKYKRRFSKNLELLRTSTSITW